MKLPRVRELEAKLAKKVRELRMERGWSQAMLARELALPEYQIQCWETRRTTIPSSALVPLTRVFNIDFDEIFGETPTRDAIPSATDKLIGDFLSLAEQLDDPRLRDGLLAFTRVVRAHGERRTPAEAGNVESG